MKEATYPELVSEAFIRPIRSVLIVDDDYPTLHEILLEPEERKKLFGDKKWNESPEERAKVRSVIDEFRKPDAPYLLDIHDGSSPDEKKDQDQVEKLQQTDLLVLDYQLDRTKVGDGSAAIVMARKALTNRHFNLILVHTQESLDDVFYKFVVGLLEPKFAAKSMAPDEELQSFLDDHEDALIASIGDSQYASAHWSDRQGAQELKNNIFRSNIWSETRTVLESSNLKPPRFHDAVRHAVAVYEQAIADRLSEDRIGIIAWDDGETKYIRAAKGFLAFKHKDDNNFRGELIPAIEKALVEWKPLPSRLMLTKLRAEINEGGIEVQDDALGESEVAAVWYLRLLEKDHRSVNATVYRTVRNHSEQLLDRLLPSVSDFTRRLHNLDHDPEKDPIEAVQSRYNINLKNPHVLMQACMGHNAFVGSKPVWPGHLELGHILRIAENYWTCVTPACDMVPEQNRGSAPDRIEGIKRFTVVKLYPLADKKALRTVNRGGHVFANISIGENELERKAFAIAKHIGESPTWTTMYIGDEGYLPTLVPPECRVSFVSSSNEGKRPCTPMVVEADATVCGMLRYEYALEIQSRFIASQSRIGLDFESSPEQEPDIDREGAQ